MTAGAAPEQPTLDDRLRSATLRCVARWGLSKTTLDDIAREAGCSRATIYRTVSGGKAALVDGVVRAELVRLAGEIDAAAEAAVGLEDVLVAIISTASRFVRDHEAFQFLLDHEPDAVLPFLAFDRLDAAFVAARLNFGPHLARVQPAWADPARTAEWIVRVIDSFALNPDPSIDLGREADARRFVRTFMLPGLTSPAAVPLSAAGNP